MKKLIVSALAFALLGGISVTESFARGGSFLNVPSDQRGLTLAETRQRELRKEKERKLKEQSESGRKSKKNKRN